MPNALREFIHENFLFGQEPSFSDDDSFLEMGIIDSTGVLELVAYLEGRHGFTIEDDELVPENLDSIHNLVRTFIERTQAAANSLASVPSGCVTEPIDVLVESFLEQTAAATPDKTALVCGQRAAELRRVGDAGPTGSPTRCWPRACGAATAWPSTWATPSRPS